MGSILKSIVEAVGSKKLVAVAASALTFVGLLVLKALGPKLGISISDGDVHTYAELLAGLVIPYLLAQWHIDVATDGKSTTAFALAQKAAVVVAPFVPSVGPATPTPSPSTPPA